MRISNLQIHNFRSIHDQKVTILDYSLLVGANNVGKSAVVDCLRCFYEKDGYKFKRERDFCYMPTEDKESWLDITFELTPEEWVTLPEYSQLENNTLKVRKFFLTDNKDKNGNKMQDSVYAYRKDGTLNDEPFHGAKSVQLGKFGKLVYIPAVSTADDHLKLSGPSALRDLLSDVLEDVIEKSTAFSQFEENFTTFSLAIKEDTDTEGRSISGLEKELNTRIAPWGAKFRLKITRPTGASIVKNLIEQEFVDSSHEQTQSISQYGSGFQRQFIFAIIDVAAQYVASKVSAKKEFSPACTMILFEEPEAFLHPPQQESLSASLQKLSLRSDTQVLCSTHSPHFVSKNSKELKGLIKVNKEEGVTSINQIDNTTWGNIVETNQAITAVAEKYTKLKKRLEADDCLAEMEPVKYFLFLDPGRCNLFFAKHVLLVEGPTERALISRLVAENKLSCSEGDISVIDTLGKYNTHRFMSLLTAFGISHSVLVDDDNGRDEHADLNEMIKNTASDMTKSITFIPGDLETFLGITPTHDHRKPQHVIMLYEKGEIKTENIKAFCNLINTAITVK